MRKPEGVGEWDGYPSANVPADRKTLSKEEERILAEMDDRITARLEAQKDKERKNS